MDPRIALEKKKTDEVHLYPASNQMAFILDLNWVTTKYNVINFTWKGILKIDYFVPMHGQRDFRDISF